MKDYSEKNEKIYNETREVRPIRILHWGLTNNRGGIESFIMDLYRNIDRNKIQFDFLLDHNNDYLLYEEEIRQLGGRVFRVLYSQRENYYKSKSCLIKFLKEHPEIVGIHVNANVLYGVLLRDAKKANLPIIIFHAHNMKSNKKESIVCKLRNILVSMQVMRYPTNYFACSNQVAECMFPNKEFRWIKNGVEINKFDYDEGERAIVRRELGIGNKNVIGFVGNLRMQKNPYFAIDVFERYNVIDSNSVLIIVGEGPLRKDLEKYVNDKGLTSNVMFLGVRKDIERLYQAMDLLLFPSLFEGFGMVVVEAQISGVPCLVSEAIPMQAKVTELVTHLSIQDSTQHWAETIVSCLSNFVRKSRKEEVRQAGFDIVSVAKDMEACYIDLYSKVK